METINGPKELIELLALINKDRKWELYLTIYPNMDKESFISFEEFSNPPKPKTPEEILADVRLISMAKC